MKFKINLDYEMHPLNNNLEIPKSMKFFKETKDLIIYVKEGKFYFTVKEPSDEKSYLDFLKHDALCTNVAKSLINNIYGSHSSNNYVTFKEFKDHFNIENDINIFIEFKDTDNRVTKNIYDLAVLEAIFTTDGVDVILSGE